VGSGWVMSGAGPLEREHPNSMEPVASVPTVAQNSRREKQRGRFWNLQSGSGVFVNRSPVWFWVQPDPEVSSASGGTNPALRDFSLS
jgi:hypothetical protein